MFREPEGKKVFETDRLAAAPTDAYEGNMDVPKGYGAKDTYWPFSSANPPISVAAPKLLSSDMDSSYMLFQPKHPPLHNQMSTHQFH